MSRKRSKLAPNHDVATWENTDKEQASLFMGSEEYQEYVSDLQEVDPFRPDDEWHDDYEERTENQRQELRAKAEAERSDTGTKKYRKQMSKRARFCVAKMNAALAAEKTDTLDDDMAVRRMRLQNLDNLVHDDSVTADEFVPKVIAKYVGD